MPVLDWGCLDLGENAAQCPLNHRVTDHVSNDKGGRKSSISLTGSFGNGLHRQGFAETGKEASREAIKDRFAGILKPNKGGFSSLSQGEKKFGRTS